MNAPQTGVVCFADAIALPSIFGANFLSVEASLVQNYTLHVPPQYRLDRSDDFGVDMSFCNVTLTHTHPGLNDAIISQIWLPIQPAWNGRLKMVGGGGWVAGLEYFTDLTMSVAVADSYATVTTNGGVSNDGPEVWALLSPGNVDLNTLQNFAYVALKDAALAAKSVVSSFFGRPADYSYFDGCSQGGRQGLAFAQRYPEIFDGIQAASPAIHTEFFLASYFPQQVMNEMKEYPHPCEIDALTNLAIEACDGIDGLVDGIISHPDTCNFDPYSAVGTDSNCGSSFTPKSISKNAAIVADASWNGARRDDESFLWPTLGYQANLTKDGGLARTVCSDNGTCVAEGGSLLTTAIRLFVKKDPKFDVTSMSRREYEQTFREAFVEFDSIIGTRSPDLYDFHKTGSKMLTYHGLVRETEIT